jgi:hypothetical protein
MSLQRRRARQCSIPGCNRPHEARGLCKACYSRWLRYGDPLAGYRPRPRDVTLPGQPREAAHRAMCRLIHGNPPTPKHQAAHSCGNGRRGCVHPGHLRWATDAENRAERRAADAARRRAAA